MKDKNEKLIEFANFVLDILEEHKEWNSDTIDEIGCGAIEAGLAGSNEDSEFVKK